MMIGRGIFDRGYRLLQNGRILGNQLVAFLLGQIAGRILRSIELFGGDELRAIPKNHVVEVPEIRTTVKSKVGPATQALLLDIRGASEKEANSSRSRRGDSVPRISVPRGFSNC